MLKTLKNKINLNKNFYIFILLTLGVVFILGKETYKSIDKITN